MVGAIGAWPIGGDVRFVPKVGTFELFSYDWLDSIES